MTLANGAGGTPAFGNMLQGNNRDPNFLQNAINASGGIRGGPQVAPMGLQQYMQGASQAMGQQPMANAYKYMSDNSLAGSNRQAAASEYAASMQPQVAGIQAQSSLANSVTGLQGTLANANAQMQTQPLNSLASMYGSNMNAVAGQNIAEMQNRARMAGLQQILGTVGPMIGGMGGMTGAPNINTNYGAGVSWGQ